MDGRENPVIRFHDSSSGPHRREFEEKEWKIPRDTAAKAIPLAHLRVDKLLCHPTFHLSDPRISVWWDTHLPVIPRWC